MPAQRVVDDRHLGRAAGRRGAGAASRSRHSRRAATRTAARTRCGEASMSSTTWPRAQSRFACVISATTVSPGSAPRTNTTRPSGSRAIASPPAAKRSGRKHDRRHDRMLTTATHHDRRLPYLAGDERCRSRSPRPCSPPTSHGSATRSRRSRQAGVDLIQWDVMDGQFVPNLTFGPDVIASVRDRVAVPFEAHLMVLTPGRDGARATSRPGCIAAHRPRRGVPAPAPHARRTSPSSVRRPAWRSTRRRPRRPSPTSSTWSTSCW